MKNISYLFFLSFLLFSCIDDDLTNISQSVQLNPSYSLPIGTIVYDLKDELERIERFAYLSSVPASDSIKINEVVYPLPVQFQQFKITQSYIFNYTMVGVDHEKIKSILFRLVIKNSFPTETILRIIFADELNYTIEEPFPDGLTIPPASFDDKGNVTVPSESILDLPVSEKLMNNFNQIRTIVIRSTVNATNPDLAIVHFNSSLNMSIHIGARIELEYNTNELSN